MKRFLILFTCLPIWANGQFADNFADGDFSSNPTWVGDAAKFEVDGGFELHLNDTPQTSTAVLATSSQAIYDASWSFKVRMTFDPSGSNFTKVYLSSDAANFNNSLNGYYVQIGGQSGTVDDVSLYRQDGTSSTILIDGTDGTVATQPEVEVLVTKNTSGVWELSIDTFSSGLTSQGTALDTTHQFSLYSGVYCKYTSTRSDKFWFDDFNVTGTALPDLNAPQLLSLSVLNATSVELNFNEPLDPTTSQNTANYMADQGLGQPQTAVLSNGDSAVTLIWSSNFSIATNYQLTINNVEDLSGNSIQNETQNFIYLNFGTPGFRDIVINEIFADPTPVIGLPEAEFIELYNPTNAYFELNGLEVSDASSTVTIPSSSVQFIAPNEYVILCDLGDSALFSQYGKVIGVPSLPALNNGGDDVKISSNGLIIDLVQYTDDWYQDAQKASGGYSLELINPTTPCTGRSNWKASSATTGGTPGAQNGVYDTTPDQVNPSMDGVSIVAINQIEIIFDESMDGNTLSNATWTITPNVAIDSFQFNTDFSAANLFLASALDSGEIYTLIINGATDCIGNALTENTIQFGIGKLPEPFDIVLNEVYFAPDDESLLSQVEFVEIFNRTQQLIRIENGTFSDASSATSLQNALLFPGVYAIICDDANADLFPDSVQVIEASALPSFNNTTDDLSLKVAGITIDAFTYNDAMYNAVDPCCTTLERINPNDICGKERNWAPSVAEIGGTPGFLNSIQDTTTITEVTFSSFNLVENRHTAELVFSGTIDTSNLSFQVAANDDEFAFDALNEGNTSLTLQSQNDLERGVVYTIETVGFKDCQGNTIQSASFEYYLHQPGDVLINEVLFNPTSTGSDFVELKSNSAHQVSLGNWSLAYYDSDDSLILPQISNTEFVLEPDEIIAFSEDVDAVVNDYPNAIATNIKLGNLPTYSNTEGTVLLYDQFGEGMDRFDYSEDMHFALIDNPDGVSLERVSLNVSTNESTNWHSASSTEGYATPGYVNSQFQEAFSSIETIELTAEYVSPDNDGYQDVVGIQYQLAEPGYSAIIKVFDHNGFEVNTITNNQLLGAEGIVYWDGTNAKGEKASIGIHVIHVLLFDLEGNQREFRLPVVVAGRL